MFWVFAIAISPPGYASPSLQQKLEMQWSRYEFARESLLRILKDPNIPPDQKTVSREVWEGWLEVPSPYILNSRDLARLERDQKRRIEEQRRKNEETSAIDLQTLRDLPPKESKEAISHFCSKFPKGGMLHIHPGGTVQRDTAKKILNQFNPTLPFSSILKTINTPGSGDYLYPDEISIVESMGADQPFLNLSPVNRANYIQLMFLPPGVQPFERFDATFLFIRPVLFDWPETEVAYLDFAKRASRENVSYVEFTTGVSSSSVNTLTEILDRIERQTGVTIRINRAFVRTSPDSELKAQLADLFTIQNDPHITGIDLIGNENVRSALSAGQSIYGTVLAAVQDGQSKLHRTMHSGEMGDPRNPRDAMILGAERLGHGVKLEFDSVALEYASLHHIPIEINLSSNLRLGVVESLKKHPFLKQLRLGLPVSLSTDDEGIFEIDINHECEIAISETDVNYTEMKKMAWNSILTSFVNEDVKYWLLKKLKEDFRHFERDEEIHSRKVMSLTKNDDLQLN
jgi:adenosine deaminase